MWEVQRYDPPCALAPGLVQHCEPGLSPCGHSLFGVYLVLGIPASPQALVAERHRIKIKHPTVSTQYQHSINTVSTQYQQSIQSAGRKRTAASERHSSGCEHRNRTVRAGATDHQPRAVRQRAQNLPVCCVRIHVRLCKCPRVCTCKYLLAFVHSKRAHSGRSVWLNWQWHAIVVGRGRDFLQLTLPCEGGTGKERRSER